MLISIGQSRFIGITMLLIHLYSLAIVYWIEVAGWLKVLLTLIVILSLIISIRKFVLRVAGDAITAIQLDSHGNMKLFYRNGTDTRVSQLRSVFVSPLVTLASVSVESGRWTQGIVIPFDAVDVEKYRQLRIRLKQQNMAD